MTHSEAATRSDDQQAAAQPTNRICVVEVDYELDMLTAPTLRRSLDQELAKQPPVLLVDLTGCEFMGSSGLAVLIAARGDTTEPATRLVLAGLTHAVSRSVDAAGLTSLFDIYPTMGEALADLGER